MRLYNLGDELVYCQIESVVLKWINKSKQRLPLKFGRFRINRHFPQWLDRTNQQQRRVFYQLLVEFNDTPQAKAALYAISELRMGRNFK